MDEAKRTLVPDPRRIPHSEINAAIERLAQGISQRHNDGKPILLLGIANGGIELARRLAAKIKQSKFGTLDISFHRDDIAQNPIPKEFAPTSIPVDVNGASVVLVDDVIFSGRTIKAALDELFDHGRPFSVELAVLVNRGGRRLPFEADFCGIEQTVPAAEKVIVTLDSKDPSADSILIGSSS